MRCSRPRSRRAACAFPWQRHGSCHHRTRRPANPTACLQRRGADPALADGRRIPPHTRRDECRERRRSGAPRRPTRPCDLARDGPQSLNLPHRQLDAPEPERRRIGLCVFDLRLRTGPRRTGRPQPSHGRGLRLHAQHRGRPVGRRQPTRHRRRLSRHRLGPARLCRRLLCALPDRRRRPSDGGLPRHGFRRRRPQDAALASRWRAGARLQAERGARNVGGLQDPAARRLHRQTARATLNWAF